MDFIDIRQILLTPEVIEAVKQYGVNLKGKGFKMDKPSRGFVAPLNRLLEMEDAFDSDIDLPPMEVRFSIVFNNVKYYSVLDGRHRFAMSIIKGLATVPVKIV